MTEVTSSAVVRALRPCSTREPPSIAFNTWGTKQGTDCNHEENEWGWVVRFHTAFLIEVMSDVSVM